MTHPRQSATEPMTLPTLLPSTPDRQPEIAPSGALTPNVPSAGSAMAAPRETGAASAAAVSPASQASTVASRTVPEASAQTILVSEGPAQSVSEESPVRINGFKADGRELNPGDRRGQTTKVGMPGRSPDTGGVSQMVLTGVSECWVHATADGTDTRQFSIQKNETFSLSFSKSLVLKLGNAGGVRLKYNGQDLPAPGTDGQVKTLNFPETEPR